MRLFRRCQEVEDLKKALYDIKLERENRAKELKAAYNLAREELGEEPTIDQIFLTRDTLREDSNGTT